MFVKPIKYLLSFAIFLSLLTFPFFAIGQTASQNLQRGTKNDSVKELQEILSNDSSIYPEGLKTGFYGPATERAVKRLQERYGLPQTGVVDETTAQVIFPSNVQLKILSPNGGEVWDRSIIHTISWQFTIGPIVYNNRQLAPSVSGSPSNAPEKQIVRPFFQKASIDLISDSGYYFYHIGTVDLFQTQYNWKIPDKVVNSSDYRVRMSVGGAVPCLEREGVPCPLFYPQYSYSDTSDSIFSIIGGGISSDKIARINALLDQIQQTINTLLNQLQSIKNILNEL